MSFVHAYVSLHRLYVKDEHTQRVVTCWIVKFHFEAFIGAFSPCLSWHFETRYDEREVHLTKKWSNTSPFLNVIFIFQLTSLGAQYICYPSSAHVWAITALPLFNSKPLNLSCSSDLLAGPSRSLPINIFIQFFFL